jgi:F-type H+-transporting ATPase subunit gamma
MESIEQIRDRLDNIRGIEPIITALRAIALSTLQGALRRLENVTLYHAQLHQVRRLLLSHGESQPAHPGQETAVDGRGCGRCALLIVGNQRGLCGPFASTVVAAAEATLARLQAAEPGEDPIGVEVMVLGEHARREVHRRGLEAAWEGALPVTSVPSSEMAAELAATGLRRYEAGELDAFYATYNRYLGAGRYEPRTVTLIPLSPMGQPEAKPPWPPPVIETDLHSLYNRVRTQLAALSFYQVLLESTAAEQSARFQLMDGASENSRRLIEELTLTYHTARQEAVTGEMLELAVSAGLVQGEHS